MQEENVYKAPSASLEEHSLDNKNIEQSHDIPKLRIYRKIMLVSLAVMYGSNLIYAFEGRNHIALFSILSLVSALFMVSFMAAVASKIYKNVGITILVFIAGFLPLINLILCIYLSVKAKTIIGFTQKRPY